VFALHLNHQIVEHSKALTTMASKRADTKVIVVGGGGTIGSSTALHLLRNGYTPANITVLDTYQIPSAQSAGHDLNKIMGVRLRNKVDLQMSLEARQMWKEDDLFKPFFHNTGRVMRIILFDHRYSISANTC
jgi:sarcosine oxidase/L-pipecolate oxidase